jgi:hypothetical protein
VSSPAARNVDQRFESSINLSWSLLAFEWADLLQVWIQLMFVGDQLTLTLSH